MEITHKSCFLFSGYTFTMFYLIYFKPRTYQPTSSWQKPKYNKLVNFSIYALRCVVIFRCTHCGQTVYILPYSPLLRVCTKAPLHNLLQNSRHFRPLSTYNVVTRAKINYTKINFTSRANRFTLNFNTYMHDMPTACAVSLLRTSQSQQTRSGSNLCLYKACELLETIKGGKTIFFFFFLVFTT